MKRALKLEAMGAMKAPTPEWCPDCGKWTTGRHLCVNPPPKDRGQLYYYQRRREYLSRQNGYRYADRDNDPASADEARA